MKGPSYQKPGQQQTNSAVSSCGSASESRWPLVKVLPNLNIWRRQWQPTPLLLPREFHGWRSLIGCSPWVKHDWATSLSLFTVMHWRKKWQPTPVFLPGESQGWQAWWAAVYGVTQSQTRLRWFSSSSWTFFGIAFLWNWNENWPFPVLWLLQSLQNLLAYWVQHFCSIIF